MYAYLKGILVQASTLHVVIECNSVGYLVSTPSQTIAKLPAIGEPLQLYTSFVIRENFQALYGFLTIQERELFEILITVSGIGPKIALGISGQLPPEELVSAIARNDLILLTKIPGIGKKTAERMVMELKDKLSTLALPNPQTFQIHPFSPDDQKLKDALSALIHLGYNQSIAQKAIQKTLKDYDAIPDLSDLITICLKNI